MRLLALPLLAGLAQGAAGAQPQPAPKAAQLFPALPQKEAWSKLPPRMNPALPEWARMLAGPLPKTTAKMLELDYLHRVTNPIGARLSIRIRLEVATALRCPFGIAAANADLRHLREHDRKDQTLGPGELSIADQKAVAFARKLTLEGHTITDKEFADLLALCGPELTTAIVHTVAHANFQNRIILALGAGGEPARPIADAFGNSTAKAPERPAWDELNSVKTGGLAVRVDWSKGGFDEMNAAMARQGERQLRIPLPDPSVYDKLPQKEKDSARRILWNTVSAGYQPGMTRAWFACLSAFYEEAKVDRVFANSVFWVVTRTNDCFY